MKEGVLHALMVLCMCFLPFALAAQTPLQVTGTVTAAADGRPLPGVTVTVQGASTATGTDDSGHYSITVPEAGATLVFTQLGMVTQQRVVTAAGIVSVSMEEDLSTLEEVVVIGYGTQKKAVVTGAITSVRADDIENQVVGRIETALQGRTSGVTITSNSGAPGSAATIRVRGVTTLNNNTPLYVVDGVVVDAGGIDYLNMSDIESIDVLKDAASAAIYGTRAASGVILVTTKKGRSGDMVINYNGYYGTQEPAKKLNLLNATEYATVRNEASLNDGGAIIYTNPASLGEGTDWQSTVFENNAPIQNHELSISGGGEKSTFYTSFGYYGQDGVVTPEISNYNRYNVRINSDHKVNNWLRFGENLGYSFIKSQGSLNPNTEFGGPLSSAINLDPLTPTIITDESLLNQPPYSNQPVVRDAAGNPYGISPNVAQEMTNPLAYVDTRLGNYGWSHNIVGNVYAEIEPIEGLRIRSTVGSKLAWWGDESYNGIYYLNAAQNRSTTNFNRSRNQGFNWNIENTVSYSREIEGHNFTVLLGQGAYLENLTSGINISFNNIAASNFDEATFNLKVPTSDRLADAYDGITHNLSSLFGRVTYDYKEKYLFTGIIRRDGSSRFGADRKYGVFPSASVGWVLTNEEFWTPTNALNNLKIRASYGVTGNDNIGNFLYVPTIGMGGGRNYIFGVDNMYIGASPNAPANPSLGWEETSQLDIGLDASLFSNWSATFDWFDKKTTGILRPVAIPGYTGLGTPTANLADLKSTGVEFELGYRKNIGDLNLGINGNISHTTNTVTFLGEDIAFIEDGAGGVQNFVHGLQRTTVGHSYNSFYGYRIAGVFQNQAEIDAYVGPEGTRIQPGAVPGDFKWADLDGDGSITSEDRTFLGTPIPTLTYGLTINAAYKNFDLLVFGQGAAGNKIFQGLRRLDITNANWHNKILGRWVGEGSTNDRPRVTLADPNQNYSKPSDFHLEDGSYLRIKTVQLGYTLPTALTGKIGLRKVRAYVSSNNLFTLTSYTGYDPEVGGGSDVWGIDTGVYPQARSFLFGLNLSL
ncbi:SusC/RagA family TonB-linked outer membrane protein [Parapedobacter soli]|uniref:SusC/RagA family TonB-linked outer membrane protein n=1 Tax=Parapedobacter soli TaxID=416955 RepID=UPI0021C7519A|nr:TonB-dependent receptor [Parapedobacter soli]